MLGLGRITGSALAAAMETAAMLERLVVRHTRSRHIGHRPYTGRRYQQARAIDRTPFASPKQPSELRVRSVARYQRRAKALMGTGDGHDRKMAIKLLKRCR